jgi:phage repressor protein C with HTH and peptisase S24 domain
VNSKQPKLGRLWPLGLYRVAGESMLPTYRPGRILVGLRWFAPRAGQVVVAHVSQLVVVKRIVRVEAAGVWLEGDNSVLSNDSRHYGLVPHAQLEARIM